MENIPDNNIYATEKSETTSNSVPENANPYPNNINSPYPPSYNGGQYSAPYGNPQNNAYYPYGNHNGNAFGGYTAPPPYTQSPASIYNAQNNCGQNGSSPQYHYGAPPTPFINPAYYREQQEKLKMKKDAEKKISLAGNISGIILLCAFVVAFFFSVFLIIPSVMNFYNDSLTGKSFINILYTLIAVGGTFAVGSKLYKIRNKKFTTLPTEEQKPIKEFNISYGLPKDGFKALLLIFISFGGCMIANYLSTVVLTFLEMFGLHSTYSSTENPQGIGDIILMVLSVAIIPPLIEELALRGFVLSELRKYGNAFAIVSTAFMFGIFHGNAAQILFAFICGLFFGYITIATESIWPAIIAHGINNSLSCITSVLMQTTDEKTAEVFYYVCSIGGIALAGVGLIIYLRNYKDDKVLTFNGDADNLTLTQKLKKFILNPGMIIAIIIYGIEALGTLTTNMN